MPTPPNTSVQGLVRLLNRMDARLSALEAGARTSQLQHASLTGTAIRVYDEDGTTRRGAIGLQPDGTIGLVATGGPPPSAPTAPAVEPSLGGLRVTWDGALADGSDLPSDFDHVAVHVSQVDGFEPAPATFAGTITRAGSGGMLPVTPLPYAEHFVRLVGVTTSAVAGPASGQTAATPLRVDGPDLEAGSVTAAAIAAGAVEADKLAALLVLASRIVAGDPAAARVELNDAGLRVYNADGTLTVQFDAATGDAVFTGTVTGSAISGGTVTGATVQTAASGARIVLDTNRLGIHDTSDALVAEITPDDGSGLAGFMSYGVGPDGVAYQAALTAGHLEMSADGSALDGTAGGVHYLSSGGGHYSLFATSGGDLGTAKATVELASESAPGRGDDTVTITATSTTITNGLTAANIKGGRINIVGTPNVPTSSTVTNLGIPANLTPRATATPVTTVVGSEVKGVAVSSVTNSSMLVWLNRTNNTSTGIDWLVIGV